MRKYGKRSTIITVLAHLKGHKKFCFLKGHPRDSHPIKNHVEGSFMDGYFYDYSIKYALK